MSGYPDSPAFNRRDASHEAAIDIRPRAETLRAAALALFEAGGAYTTHEVAQILRQSVPAIQPRLSELAAKDIIVDSGERRVNAASGKRAIVWWIPRGQLSLF